MGTHPENGNGKGIVASAVVHPDPSPFAGLTLDASITQTFVDVLKEYLGTLHCSSIGQAFDVHDDEGRERCARWFAQHVFGALELAAA